MNERTKQEIMMQIRGYAQFMSFESAVNKVKRSNLNRIDFWVDEVAAQMRGAS